MRSETLEVPSPGTATAIGARGIGLRAGERWILREVSLELAAGERLALVGPNGAGKSTLVRVLTGVTAPTTGSIAIEGEPIASLDRQRLARRMAVVAGDGRLPFAMTVEELVSLGRTPWLHAWAGPSAVDQAAVLAAMIRVGVVDMRQRDVRTLSLGERQLVLIATALAQGGRILMLDEPTVHLDLRHQVAVMELLTRLSEEDGMTILAVLHDLSLARDAFPRMALLDQGRLVADGTPDAVLSPERVREVYGVDPRYVASRVEPPSGDA